MTYSWNDVYPQVEELKNYIIECINKSINNPKDLYGANGEEIEFARYSLDVFPKLVDFLKIVESLGMPPPSIGPHDAEDINDLDEEEPDCSFSLEYHFDNVNCGICFSAYQNLVYVVAIQTNDPKLPAFPHKTFKFKSLNDYKELVDLILYYQKFQREDK